MKYRFSNYEENTIAKDGQPRDTRAECDICGVMHRGDHGYELEYGMLHLYGRYRSREMATLTNKQRFILNTLLFCLCAISYYSV